MPVAPAAGATTRPLGLVVAARLTLFAVLTGGLLFIAAGTVAWPRAWVAFGTIQALGAVFVTIGVRQRPDLVRERISERGDAKPWDRWFVMGIAIVLPPVALLVAGLDHRLAWTGDALGPVAAAAGLALAVLGQLLLYWATFANRFFSSVVRIQTDRGHVVETGGPYRFVRHPGYVGGALYHLGFPVALGSLWALLPSLLIIVLLVLRTRLEDRTLQDELAGYREYAARVRWRLLPGVW